MDKNKVTNLNHLSVLEISGEGAFDLLQGQITCDVNKVDSNNSCLFSL
jgi:folate-binding Fe-S cluster repair protein YgfZ